MNKEQTIRKAEDTLYEEIKDANFFKFENIGDKLEGMLLEKGISQRYNFGLFTAMTKEGEKKRFHGTTHMDTLMSEIEPQDYFVLELIDTEETPAGDMKIFKLLKKK